jgi:oxygen-independent coproporphyrinogen-3 oxidase
MCDFRIDAEEIVDRFDISRAALNEMFSKFMAQFPDVLALESNALVIPEPARPLTRMIARAFDAYDMSKAQHSAAI